MKTKDEAEKVEKLRSRAVEESSGKGRHTVPVTLRETLVGFSTPQLLDSWTAESTEQSENVYENKGPLWTSRMPLVRMAGRVPRCQATSGPESPPGVNALAES
jgi:hypothetical protein